MRLKETNSDWVFGTPRHHTHEHQWVSKIF
ncbi:hypothetical protein SAMN05444170_5757 [Bradyrhizobium erythrophlei]|jgi:hypothetical protein|uniref:Uncharacterized protein n=1 Tax=Bradyrhizobium erythrophlei TaxID=1437360 RepID=A0A1M7UM33_9BRAD|nr:hypothetical protein SAMN05444170_5757 [Bradyrhizobium erythrophlei]